MINFETITRPFKLTEVKQAVLSAGMDGMQAAAGRGCGRQRGHRGLYRSSEYEDRFIPRVRLEVIVADDLMAHATGWRIAATGKTGQTGGIGEIGDAEFLFTTWRKSSASAPAGAVCKAVKYPLLSRFIFL